MSIIKRPYEISVWRDVLTNDSGTNTPTALPNIDYTSENLTSPVDSAYENGLYLQEEKIAIIGSNTMTSQNKVSEPVLHLDVKGTTTLTFDIYRRYYDNQTGELVENPFFQYIQNEQKIKLYYDDGTSEDKWRDFIITSISPESTNYKVTVIATDAAVMELSKIGFNKTFNSELQNNTDTISNLARHALDETVWELDNSSEEIKQFQTDNLVRLKVKQNVYFYLYSNDNYTVDSTYKAYITENNYVYGFYSELAQSTENIKDIHIIFLADTISKDTTNHRYNITTREATNADFIDNVLQNNYFAAADVNKFDHPNWATYKNVNIPDTYFKVSNQTISDDIVINFLKKGEKLIQNQLTCYDPILNRYVKKYTKNGDNRQYYGYEDAEYTVEPLVQNLITNGEKEVSLDGWLTAEEECVRQVKLQLSQIQSDPLVSTDRKNYSSFPTIKINTDATISNMEGITGQNPEGHILQAQRTHFTNFILNTGFNDNKNIINNLKVNDKFRMQINVEQSEQSVSGLKELVGLHPYILRLPSGVNSSNLSTNLSSIGVTITKSGYNATVTNNPIIVNFSYIPEEYRMYDYDHAWYFNYNHTTNTATYKTNLAPYAEGNLVPIYLKKHNDDVYTQVPIFYCPYWRLYDYKYNNLIDNSNSTAFSSSGGSGWDGTYAASIGIFYLTTAGENNLLSYLQGTESRFAPLDFCIISDLNDFIQWSDITTNFIYNNPNVGDITVPLHLKIKENIFDLYSDFFVMFTNINDSGESIFLRPDGIDTEAKWLDWLGKARYYRESYHYYKINDIVFYKKGYFTTSNFIMINNGCEGSVELNNANTSRTWSGITFTDLEAILRVRNIWKLVHYEPSKNENDREIPQAYCTFETEGTYKGLIQQTVGDYNVNYVPSTGNKNTKITYTYDASNLLQDDLNEQENIILFSNYGNYATDQSLTSGHRELVLSHILLTRYYKDSNGKVVTPETIPAASTRTIYKYFNDTYGRTSINDVQKSSDILYDYQGYIKDSTFIPQMNLEGLAYNSITTTESNLFNILQKLCEIFNCWLKISLEHDSNGRIILENGKPKGKISFHKYIGDNLSYGFIKGLNLESLQRTDVSDEITTKMIVKQNSNEFGKDKICTINRSTFNPLGTNEIYNFDYYINKGILESNIYDILQTYYGKPLNQIKTQILSLQEDIKQLAVTITQLQSERDYYKTQYNSATGQITSYKEYFETLTGKSYIYYLNNMSSMNNAWKNDGLISLYEEYKEKIKYFISIQDFAYRKWQEYESQYNESYNNYMKKNKLILILTEHRSKIMKEFYNIYHAYIHESSWISEDYLDDDKYYFAATDVLNTSAQPKVTYSFNVVDIGALDEFKGYNFKLGDKTFVEDTEFFGYQEDGVTPYREEVTISGMEVNLDSPDKNTITIQNYRTQFQDLFQRIAATIQAVEYHTGNYRNTKSDKL